MHGAHNVPDDEPCCQHTLQCMSRRCAGYAAAGDMGRDGAEELPDGAAVEPLRCGAADAADIPRGVQAKYTVEIRGR